MVFFNHHTSFSCYRPPPVLKAALDAQLLSMTVGRRQGGYVGLNWAHLDHSRLYLLPHCAQPCRYFSKFLQPTTWYYQKLGLHFKGSTKLTWCNTFVNANYWLTPLISLTALLTFLVLSFKAREKILASHETSKNLRNPLVPTMSY